MQVTPLPGVVTSRFVVAFLFLFCCFFVAAVGDDCVPEVRLADFGSAFMQHRQICTARDYTVAYR